MKRFLLFIATILLTFTLMAQSVTLTFTGRDTNNNYCQLNRVVITNLTKEWQETIYWPDTTLTMQAGTSIEDYAGENAFVLSQNNPNPFNGTTDAKLTVVEPGDVLMEISDVNGRIIETQNFASLQTGNHRFRIQVSTAGIYFLTARQRGRSSTIKMVNNGSGSDNSIEFVGLENQDQAFPKTKNSIKGATNNPFSFGDNMEYVGYATINDTEEESQIIQQQQNASENFTLQFDVAPHHIVSRPCRDAVTLTDIDGNVYNTVQLGEQCWMKENLRTTKFADGTIISLSSDTSSHTAYRYYPNNDANNVSTYGYLYNWLAVMHDSPSSSSNPSGVQGICPTGWHVPSDTEWTQLYNYVKSQPDFICAGCSGIDDEWQTNCIAKALASTLGWNNSQITCAIGNNQNTNNATGFSAVPAGTFYGEFNSFGCSALFWSSTEFFDSYQYSQTLFYDNDYVNTSGDHMRTGLSVRCIKD